jgi:IS5 family transposase
MPLSLIREKLAVTQGSIIAITILVMNLQKLLEVLFVLFAHWLEVVLSNQSEKSSRFWCLSTQVTPA